MNKTIIALIFSLSGLLFLCIFIVRLAVNKSIVEIISPLSKEAELAREVLIPLDKYSFEQLAQVDWDKEAIRLENILEDNEQFTSYLFSFSYDDRKITGQMNIPKVQINQKYPAIILIRGYADKEIYTTGVGTRNAAAEFARNGYITAAPDFLGYGGSDPEPEDVLEARFIKPAIVIQLISNLSSESRIDDAHIGLWGHSNGGQISLSVLEIINHSQFGSNKIFPTSLWAPVSKPFPYSILYYMDESHDGGKSLRKKLAHFENSYHADEFSIHHYWDWIKSPIQLHQGTKDEEIPIDWGDELVKNLKNVNIEVNYFVYPGADHNLRPDWNLVIQRDLDFYEKYLKNE